MLSAERNDYLTKVGQGTPMGALLRSYWLPLLYSDELPDADGAPVRVQLLGEKLMAFRDSAGRVGLLDHRCPHRGASLFYGRNEAGGLRCAYHGWKFDIDGRCLEIPSEGRDCPLLAKITARSYPCREANGIIWTYMGPGELPPLPTMGWASVPAVRKSRLKYIRYCNWIQAMEGDFDSAHLGFLHRRLAVQSPSEGFRKVDGGDALRPIVAIDTHPAIEVRDTSAGVMYGALRRAPEGQSYWRVTQFHLPFYTSVPAYGGLNRLKIWVPIDDHHVMVWEANWTTAEDLDPQALKGTAGRVGPSGFLPDNDEWHGRGRFAARAENDYMIDRTRQKAVNFTGMEDETPVQDAAMQESMGPIVDRTLEHLVSSDAAIIRMRQCLLRAAGALQSDGSLPPGVSEPHLYRSHGEQGLDGGAGWEAEYDRAMARFYADMR
jgi:phenylpropionate dioxygenase-like ring-hydroxylating dioxygenase large terminal subunit